MIRKDSKVKVIKLVSDTANEYDPLTYEHTSCFLGQIGVVTNEPVWLESEPNRGPLGKIIAKGECWVEFGDPCKRHGETGAIFNTSELEAV